ncbi:transporter [Streptomyces mashuensis]|uniref:Transporter n=1 Tax=Streptomyces mashuensis TaxID=33904 RepID=A0A919B9E5_9ACTN|nr:transporter [Streptomyces mashuensis]GHF74909.1 transporter [Streptomyces mashuensis]
MRGTLWLAWRQQRATVLVAAAVLAVCAVWVAFRRADMMAFLHDHSLSLAGCKGWDAEECTTGGAGGPELVRRVLADNTGAIRALGALSAAVPVLVGLFWGAPLIGRELETGTTKLALTQGAGLRAWFASRFALAAVCAVTCSAVLAALVAWWWGPISNSLDGLYWYDGFIFNATGPAAVGCALFGLAAGTAAGVLHRRTLPAMGSALAAVVLVRLSLQVLRPEWIAPERRVTPGMTPKKYVGSAWSTGEFGYLDKAGREYPISHYCQTSGAELRRCMAEEGFVARYHKVRPAGDFWILQWIETAVFIGLAAALIAATYAVLRRRLV